MSSSVILAVALAAAPCTRVAVTPFEPVAVSPAEAKAVELEVRAALEHKPGLCVEPRAQTVEKLARFPEHRLPPCGDTACTSAQLEALGAALVIDGIVVGAGGHSAVALAGQSAAGTARASASSRGAELAAAVELVLPGATVSRTGPTRWPAIAAVALGVASAGAGVLLGLQAKHTELAVVNGTTGCAGQGTAYRDCFDQTIRDGRGQALGANVFFVASGVLAVGGGLLWGFDLP